MLTGNCWHPFFFITHLENSLHSVDGTKEDKLLFQRALLFMSNSQARKSLNELSDDTIPQEYTCVYNHPAYVLP